MQSLDEMAELLKKIQALQLGQQREVTIFDIGGRGYYENPTSDLLQFFFNDSAAHGLNNLVLKTFVDCLPDEFKKIDCSLISPPEREVRTNSGKRIDLLLDSNKWVMVIENKIFHHLDNPFADYEEHLQNHSFKDAKTPICVVLSPDGTVPKEYVNWVGVSYPAFIEALKINLSDWFFDNPMNKWAVLLREFMLNLEHLMSKPSLSTENLDFVLNNLQQIKEAQDFKIEMITRYQDFLVKELNKSLETELKSTIELWYGYPAIRFAMQDWYSGSDVVLFLDGRAQEKFAIHYYCDNIKSDEQRQQADALLQEADCAVPWNELKGRCRGYKTILNDRNLPAIQQKLAHKISLMAKFEKTIRQRFSNE